MGPQGCLSRGSFWRLEGVCTGRGVEGGVGGVCWPVRLYFAFDPKRNKHGIGMILVPGHLLHTEPGEQIIREVQGLQQALPCQPL